MGFWVSPLLVVPTKDETSGPKFVNIRPVIHIRKPNTAVLRTQHPIPNIKLTLQKINDYKVFSELDLKQG